MNDRKDNLSLLALVKNAAQIEEMLVFASGEITPEIEAALSMTEVQLPEKIDNYSLLMDRMESISEFYKAKAEFYLRLAKSANNVIERCESNLKTAMEALNVDELSGNDVRYRLQKSNPSCVIEDENAIDGSYLITETVTKLDKKKMLEDLKLGIPVRGARLFQRFYLRRYANTPAKKSVNK